MLDYYVVTTCTDKPISEVEREFRRETALQNLLLWAGGNVQDPRRTARPEKLEAEAFWGAGRVAALVSRGCKQEQGQAFVLVRYPRRGSAERGQAVSPDGLWAELCALWGSSGRWPDLETPGPMAVAAASCEALQAVDLTLVYNRCSLRGSRALAP